MITWAQIRECYRRARCEVPRSCGRWSDPLSDQQLLRLIGEGVTAVANVDEIRDDRDFVESERDEAVDALEVVERERDEARQQLDTARRELAQTKAELEKERDAGEREAIEREDYPTAWDRIAHE